MTVEMKRNNKVYELTEAQHNAIARLIEHVFGDRETYDYYREHHVSFPNQYVVTKEFFMNSPWINEEFAETVIAGVPIAVVFNETTHEQKSTDGEGTKGESIKVDYHGIPDAMIAIQRLEKGSHAKGHAWDPLDYKTFKQRISSFQSWLRRHNHNEEIVAECAKAYTRAYNDKFGTDFEVYLSKKTPRKIKI